MIWRRWRNDCKQELRQMMLRTRLEKKIKKSIEETVSEYSTCLPKIVEHFFYGAIEIAPQYLVIWYLFDRNSDLAEAQASGLCERIRRATVHHLKDHGYPVQAFEVPKPLSFRKITISGNQKKAEELKAVLKNRKISVAFTSKEDIESKAHGDYRLYFQ